MPRLSICAALGTVLITFAGHGLHADEVASFAPPAAIASPAEHQLALPPAAPPEPAGRLFGPLPQAGPTGLAPSDDPLVTKLKAQIKTVRLSLAETVGRLSATERNLATASADSAHLRIENASLQVRLATAETTARKAEDEVQQRRGEMGNLVRLATAPARPSGLVLLGLLLCLAVAAFSAVLLVGQGGRLQALAARQPEPRQEQDRDAALRAELSDAQQKSLELEAECHRLRELDGVSSPAPGSRRERFEHLRRELREVRGVAEAEKRKADGRIQALEDEVVRLSTDRQRLELAMKDAMEKLAFYGHEEAGQDAAPQPG